MNHYTEEIKHKIFFYIFSLLLMISFSGCNGCDNSSNPTGPSEGTPYAVQVVSSNITCEGINLYTNPNESLGAPNWGYNNDGSYSGFVSLGPDGYIVLKMGVDVIDGPGPDIKVYQAVSYEDTAVYVTDDYLFSPFKYLGNKACGVSCSFDLSGSGYSKIRYVMVKDMTLSECYETPGPDIDAVEALNYK